MAYQPAVSGLLRPNSLLAAIHPSSFDPRLVRFLNRMDLSTTDSTRRVHEPIEQCGELPVDIYFDGLEGGRRIIRSNFAAAGARSGRGAAPVGAPYVAGGAGDESTQRANIEASPATASMPRMLRRRVRAGLSVSLFDMELPTPLFMCPIGSSGCAHRIFHGDIAVAKASAQTGVPMVASTLTQDRMEDVAPHAGDTPGSSSSTHDRQGTGPASCAAPSSPGTGACDHPRHVDPRMAGRVI